MGGKQGREGSDPASRWPWSRIVLESVLYAAALALGAAVAFLQDLEPLALAYFAVARLAYVITVSIGLRAQSARLGLEPRETAERRHEVFNRLVLRLQNVDAIAFVSLCVSSSRTMPWKGWEWAFLTSGALLGVVGIGVKAWAVRCLGPNSYTWHDFFVPKEKFEPCRTGPYRWFSDPMYTLGYLHTYGLALACGSWHGFAASIFAHSSILIVNELVEKPHFRRLCAAEVKPAESP
jgi:protein-S-isoprenylcysteine O-methyltransferase Ste14